MVEERVETRSEDWMQIVLGVNGSGLRSCSVLEELRERLEGRKERRRARKKPGRERGGLEEKSKSLVNKARSVEKEGGQRAVGCERARFEEEWIWSCFGRPALLLFLLVILFCCLRLFAV